MPSKEIIFTQNETEKLVQATREAAVAMQRMFEALRQVGDRAQVNWTGTGETVSEIVDDLSSYVSGDGSGAEEIITASAVTRRFGDPLNWTE